MLTKLAFKNVGKSFRDYAVYFFTLVLGVSIFYMFNSIYAQQEIMVITETTHQAMKALREILSYISIFVAVILGFLIVYANNFFVKRRKKELGIYMTLGMTKTTISTILLLETSLMALAALVIGLIAGIFGSQFMSVFTAKLFEADLTAYKFVFSSDALWKSVLYFGVIFSIVILFNVFSISKFKLIDLIYGGRKNENLKVQNIWISVVVFIFSVISLSAAYIIILKNGIINIDLYFLLSIILGTIGTVLFFLSLSGFLIKILQSKKRIYYRNLNMFVLRQLNSKINTNFISISVVCIVLLLVIGVFSSGYSLQNVLSNELKSSVAYDFSIYNYSVDDNDVSPIYDNLPKQIQNVEGIYAFYEYQKYIMVGQGNRYEDYDVNTSSIPFDLGHMTLDFISLSDYNGIRDLQGLPTFELPENRFAIICPNDNMTSIASQFSAKKLNLKMDGLELAPMETIEKVFIDNNSYGGITFIVNDELTEIMDTNESILNIQTKNIAASKAFQKELKHYQKNMEQEGAFIYYQSKIDIYEASITTKALVSFLAIYLGVVFMITCAAILAIQQLSEATDNKERYELLKKLGTEKQMINKALFIQILCYFLLPLLLAVIHSAVGLSAVNDVIKQLGHIDIASSIATTGAFVIFVYGAYFGLTYMGSKKIINKG